MNEIEYMDSGGRGFAKQITNHAFEHNQWSPVWWGGGELVDSAQ